MMPPSGTGTAITPVTVKGGVLRVIDSATGDIARTTAGWVEAEQYGWRANGSGSFSAEFDSAEKRTGRLTLKASTTGAASFIEAITFLSATPASMAKYMSPIKPNTSYRFTCAMKTNYVSGDATNGAAVAVVAYSAAGGSVSSNVGTYIKTTTDWTLYTLNFTTPANAVYVAPYHRVYGHQGTANLVMDAWFDVNSMTLEEVSSVTNSTSSPVLLYPTITGVTSTDNIDQSADATGAYANTYTTPIAVSEAAADKLTFTPTKKYVTGIDLFVVSKGTGNWTVRVHDAGNVVLGEITIANATLTNGAFFTFRIPINWASGAFHVHAISTVADGTIKCNVAADLSTASYIQRYAKKSDNFSVTTSTDAFSAVVVPDGVLGGAIINTQAGTYTYSKPNFANHPEYLSDVFSYQNRAGTSAIITIGLPVSTVAAIDNVVFKHNLIYPTSSISMSILSTIAATRSFKVQYSTDNSTYTDWATFIDTDNNVTKYLTATIGRSPIVYIRLVGISSSCYVGQMSFTATLDTSTAEPIILQPGTTPLYFSSNGPATADATQDPSYQAIIDGAYYSFQNENAERDQNRVTTLLAASNINDSSPLNVYSKENALMVNDGSAITGGTGITQVSVKGGVLRVIDSATGDIAQTTNAWIENEKYGWWLQRSANICNAEFDSAVTRTGRLTLKLSTLDVTGAGYVSNFNANAGTASVSLLSKYAIPVKGGTTYKLNCYAKTNNVLFSYIMVQEYNAAGTRLTTYNSNTLTGTNDWSLITNTRATQATTAYVTLLMYIPSAGNISDAWFDVNSMTLEEVSTITNSTSTPALLYPTFTAVSSTDNIDQSQVVSTGSLKLGDVSTFNQRKGQTVTLTKKNFLSFVFQKDANTGSPVSDVNVTLQSTTASLPNGNILAQTLITAAQWDAITNLTDYTVTLTPASPLDTSLMYAVVFIPTTTDASNYRNLRGNSGNVYSGGTEINYNGTTYSAGGGDMYFKTLYQKNTDNFTIATDTETLTYTAPTTDGWANGTVIDTYALNLNPINLAPGVNNVYYSSNGASTADGTQDASMLATVDGTYYPVTYRNAARDENHVPVVLAVSADDGVTPVPVYCDWFTRELLVKST